MRGVLCAVGAYTVWGFLPLYWKQLAGVPALEILSHRIVWSLLFFMALQGLISPGNLALRQYSNRVWRAYGLSGCLIGTNWLIFIWAVTSGHVLQSSLGYFLSPLASVAIGAIFFGEKLGTRHKVAVALAASGACVLMVGASSDVWIALLLTLTFCLYGVARRLAPLPSLQGMYLETLLLTPLGLAYLAWAAAQGQLCLITADAASRWLMVGAGPVTAVPLLLFSEAARRLTLAHLGMFQYLSPSLQFLLAVGHYHENFSQAHALSFALIWTGLLIFATARQPEAPSRP